MNPHLKLVRLCHNSYLYTGSQDGFYYLKEGNVIIVSGTDSWFDWKDNFDVFPCRPYHKAFTQYAEGILNEISVNRNTVFIGHSAGGAIAHICAALSGTEAVSIGSPWFQSRPAYNTSRHIFYASKGDVISQLGFGFKHLSNTKRVWLSYRPNHSPSEYWRALHQDLNKSVTEITSTLI